MLPRAVCLMPTYNRPEMAHRAVHLFLEQDYQGAKHLLVDDDGELPLRLCPSCGGGTEVEVVTNEKAKLPLKRNRMMLHVGDPEAIYLSWDDDDYHGPGRIRRQVEAILAGTPRAQASALCPQLYYNALTRDLKLSKWLSDGNIAYTFGFWSRRNYPDQHDPGSGWRYLDGRKDQIVMIDGELDYVVVVHDGQRHAPPAFGFPDFTDAPVDAAWVEERLRQR